MLSHLQSSYRQGRLWEYELEARWDIQNTPYALEVEVEQGRNADRFRIDERRDDTFRQPEVQASIVHKDLLGMQWTLRLQNIADFEFRREPSARWQLAQASYK